MSDKAKAAVMARFNKVVKEIHPIMLFELTSILDDDGTKRERMTLLAGAVDKMMAIVQPETPCHRGCSHCCHMATMLSETEANIIGEAIGRKPVAMPGRLPDREAQVAKHMRVPCTFLRDNECSIYDVRPIACRAHHSLEDTPDPCNLSTASKVGSINMQNVHIVTAAIQHDLKHADIREYFPNGRD